MTLWLKVRWAQVLHLGLLNFIAQGWKFRHKVAAANGDSEPQLYKQFTLQVWKETGFSHPVNHGGFYIKVSLRYNHSINPHLFTETIKSKVWNLSLSLFDLRMAMHGDVSHNLLVKGPGEQGLFFLWVPFAALHLKSNTRQTCYHL